MSIKSSLLIKEFELTVSLGWSDEERAHKQSVLINIELQFQQPPMACQSDELVETHCYDALTDFIYRYTSDKSFRLVEYLAGEIYLIVKKEVGMSIGVKVEVIKQPEITHLNGGVYFRYGDFA